MKMIGFVLVLSLVAQNMAFVPQVSISMPRMAFRSSWNSILFSAGTDNNEDGNGRSNNDEIESMRRRLEQTVASTRTSEVVSTTQGLSTTAKERRKYEIELLEDLAYSDEPMNELWALWFVEKGPGPASQLLATQDYFQKVGNGDKGSAKQFQEIEQKLREIIREHGVSEWAEPINRLATIYYLQGKFKESIAMCELVLDIKPWHFGCLSGIVMCYAELGDRVNARLWASRRLPPLEAIERREEWVKRAVSEAERSLERHSRRSLETMVKEDFVDKSGIKKDMADESSGGVSRLDDDAWQ